MAKRNLKFKITDDVGININLDRERVVISCKTEDGKSLHLEADYQTIDKLHHEIESQRWDHGPELRSDTFGVRGQSRDFLFAVPL
jgi:hypothetical protein